MKLYHIIAINWLYHIIAINWLYHNDVISHNCEITVFFHDITYEIMCDTILPFLGSCDVEKKHDSCVISSKIDDIT